MLRSDEVLEVRTLAPDGLDLRRAELVDEKTKPRTGFDWLELIEVSNAQDLRPGALGELEDGSHLPNRKHPCFVHEENRLVVEHGLAGADLAEESREAVGLDFAFGAEVDRGPPGQSARDDAIPGVAIEICDGSKGDCLSRAGRAEANGE